MPLTNWLCSRPHLPHCRSRASFDFGISFGRQSPGHTHCATAKYGEYHCPHGANHTDNHPLLACHRHRPGRARSPRASPSPSVSGRCEDQGRNTQYGRSSDPAAVRQGEGGGCIGEWDPRRGFEKNAGGLPFNIQLSHGPCGTSVRVGIQRVHHQLQSKRRAMLTGLCYCRRLIPWKSLGFPGDFGNVTGQSNLHQFLYTMARPLGGWSTLG